MPVLLRAILVIVARYVLVVPRFERHELVADLHLTRDPGIGGAHRLYGAHFPTVKLAQLRVRLIEHADRVPFVFDQDARLFHQLLPAVPDLVGSDRCARIAELRARFAVSRYRMPDRPGPIPRGVVDRFDTAGQQRRSELIVIPLVLRLGATCPTCATTQRILADLAVGEGRNECLTFRIQSGDHRGNPRFVVGNRNRLAAHLERRRAPLRQVVRLQVLFDRRFYARLQPLSGTVVYVLKTPK
jgi:hypothetical protein